MNSYQVTITYEQSVFADLTITLEAESEEEACSRAKEMDDDDLIDYSEAEERGEYLTGIFDITAILNKEQP
jgi:hypothetical protein